MSNDRYTQLVNSASRRKPLASPKYCVEPILKKIPSLAVEWPSGGNSGPTRGIHASHSSISVMSTDALNLREGNTLIDIQLGDNYL